VQLDLVPSESVIQLPSVLKRSFLAGGVVIRVQNSFGLQGESLVYSFVVDGRLRRSCHSLLGGIILADGRFWYT
jgi:hypothetical protein